MFKVLVNIHILKYCYRKPYITSPSIRDILLLYQLCYIADSRVVGKDTN